MSVVAIIPAAGQGLRMGGATPKQFLSLAGRPVLYHTLQAFAASGLVDAVILAVPEAYVNEMRAEWLGGVVKKVIAGGAQRQDSVYNGLCAVDPCAEIVAVHDGVRPFFTRAMLAEGIAAARECGAAITAIPLSDTIKRVDAGGFVERTVARDGLWRVQTPQVFRHALLREAMDKAMAAAFYGTDEGALIEFAGKPLKVVRGSAMNIKITTPEDMELGEQIIAARQAASGRLDAGAR